MSYLTLTIIVISLTAWVGVTAILATEGEGFNPVKALGITLATIALLALGWWMIAFAFAYAT